MKKETTLNSVIGEELLNNIQKSYLKYIESSAAVFEVNGDYAAKLFTSKYCDFLDQASRDRSGKSEEEALKSGKWICHECCWAASLKSIKEKKPCEIECSGGIKIFAAPIIVEGKVSGSNNAGVSNPPTDENKIREIAERFKVDPKELLQIAKEYLVRPDYIFDAAKHHILMASYTIAELFLRKQAEIELRKSEEKFSQLVENINEIFWLENLEGTEMLYVSPAYELLRRRTCQSLYDNPKSWTDAIHPEDRQRVIDAFLHGRINGTYSEEFRIIRPDGSIRWVRDRCFPIRDASGKVYRIAGIAEDITERRLAQRDLQESKERFRMFSEASSEGIAITEKGIILEVNKRLAEMVCYDQKELLGKKATEVVPQECQKDVMEKILSDYDKPYETMLKRKDGGAFPVEVCGKPIMFHGRKARLTSLRDLSYLKEAEKEKDKLLDNLKQAQKMEAIGNLAGGISHDFNNILSSIVTFTELSLLKTQNDSEAYAYLKHILNSALRGRDLVKHILSFSRKKESELTIVQLPQAVKEVLELIKPTMPSTIKIRSNIDANSGGVMADLAQIHQIFINLCINAEHAMRKKGGVLGVNLESVHIDARFSAIHFHLKEGDYLKLTVSDTGHGMSKKVIKQIFKPFFSTKISEEGTGLGLATVHGIVLGLGGDIIVNSELGIGATFVVYLPEIKDIVTEKKTKYLTIPRGNERILFVDDEEDIVRGVQEMLENLGYEVITTTSSFEALEIFKKGPQKFDLVITDQTMPNMTGDVLARKLMQIRSEIPVILCTGFTHKITEKKANAIGIQEFIMKPFVTTHFANIVRKVLDQNKKGS